MMLTSVLGPVEAIGCTVGTQKMFSLEPRHTMWSYIRFCDTSVHPKAPCGPFYEGWHHLTNPPFLRHPVSSRCFPVTSGGMSEDWVQVLRHGNMTRTRHRPQPGLQRTNSKLKFWPKSRIFCPGSAWKMWEKVFDTDKGCSWHHF